MVAGVDRPGSSVPTASSMAVGRDQVDALPRADVDAALAHDALGLVDVDELLGLDRLGQPVGVDLLEDVVVPELRHRRVGVGLGHRQLFFTSGRP